MKLALRILVGVSGLAGLALAMRFWLATGDMARQVGISPQGALGLASIRADIAGFFAAAGILAAAAAVLDRRRLMTAPLLMIALALSGRILSLGMTGPAQELVAPMAIEVGLLAVFGAGRSWLGVPTKTGD